MADSVASLLVEKLAMLVEKEVKQLKGVRREIKSIKDEFEHMKAFLERAESLQEDDPQLKVRVKDVIEVAYDMEDILDEFMLKLARDHGHGFTGYLRKIKSSIQNLKARHRISSKIADIKSRVISISEIHQRYKWHCIEQSASTSNIGTSWHDLRGDSFLVEEGELVGIDEPRKKIIEWLVDGEPGLEIISIVGMGGLGKTTLAGRVYDNQQVKAYFQSHVWINISQSYKIDDILRDVIVRIHSEFQQSVPEGLQFMTSTSLKKIVNEFLQQKRYVVVLDDVWKKEAVEGIKNALPNSSFGSRIIITTRMTDIATYLPKQSKIYTLQPLSPEESLFLLCKKAFCGNPCPFYLKDFAQQFLKRCEGLPIAIVTIGGLLFGKDVQEWKMISHSLAAKLESNDIMQNCRKILSLSYNDLDYNLKSCFFYMGVFPEDHVIDCMILIRLWIAEGFVKESEGTTREEVAQGYLKKLINRSLVQIVKTTLDGRLKSCRVHDLLRENILSKLRDVNFVSVAYEQRVELPERARYLSVQYTSNEALEQHNLPYLHSLLIFESATSSRSDEQFVPGVSRLLRVLDLGNSPLREFPQQILVLFHLKYLSLRRTKVQIIPRSIGKLQNLESLDLKYTLVSELPVEITKLKKLQYLLVYNYKECTTSTPFGATTGFSAPEGIGKLTSLQKLSFVKARGGKRKNTVQELGELTQLMRLGVGDLKKDDAQQLCHSLVKMTNLRSLNVIAESEYEIIDLKFPSSPPPLLQCLYIEGCLEKLPNWLGLLTNLTRLRLKWTKLKSSPLIALQELPNLVELCLTQTFDEETLVFEDKGFPKLKKLLFIDLKNLRFVSMNGQAMPGLQDLIIDGCKLLDWQSLLVVVRGLTLLTRIVFCDMPEEFALAFYPHRKSRMMREGVLQDCYEDVMKRNPEVYFLFPEEDQLQRYNLTIDHYYLIRLRVKRRVMSHGGVLPEVS